MEASNELQPNAYLSRAGGITSITVKQHFKPSKVVQWALIWWAFKGPAAKQYQLSYDIEHDTLSNASSSGIHK